MIGNWATFAVAIEPAVTTVTGSLTATETGSYVADLGGVLTRVAP